MTDVSAASQQLFDLWKKQLEEGAQTWARSLGGNPTVTPDLMGQWKQFLDQSIEAWSKALSQVMSTEAYAQAMGKALEQWTTAVAPAKKQADQAIESALQALNVPTRAQVTSLAKQLVDLEERI